MKYEMNIVKLGARESAVLNVFLQFNVLFFKRSFQMWHCSLLQYKTTKIDVQTYQLWTKPANFAATFFKVQLAIHKVRQETKGCEIPAVLKATVVLQSSNRQSQKKLTVNYCQSSQL